MSSSLLWELTKKNNCFLKSGNELTFSKDPLNLSGKNCFRYSGLVNKKAINVVKDKNNKIVLLTKSQKQKQQKKPSKLVKKTQFRAGKRRTLNGIRSNIVNNNNRKELLMVLSLN